MMNSARNTIVFSVILTFSLVASFANSAQKAKTGPGSEDGVLWKVEAPATLIAKLRQGGNVIYFRHAPTEPKKKDNNRQLIKTKVDYKNCAVQRNLSTQGRDVAADIRDHLKRLKIPVKEIYSSPYCRAADTAKILFSQTIKHDPNLGFSLSRSAEDSRRLGLYLKQMITQMKPRKSNIVIIGHSSNLRDGLGVWPKPEGVAVVFKPDGKGVIYRGMITPTQWQLVSE